jgi:NAD(P)-dependent dehydrogenase (short-subunit alcohol dehydrogenase family)/acyl carrier protein
MDRYGVGMQLKGQLERRGFEVITIEMGEIPTPPDEGAYDQLLRELAKQGKIPLRVYHLWGIGAGGSSGSAIKRVNEALDWGFYSLLFLVRALDAHGMISSQEMRFEVVTGGVYDVTNEEELCPEKAPIYGLCSVISQEYPNIHCRCIDIPVPPGEVAVKVIRQLMKEFACALGDPVVAYRGDYRWVRSFKPLRLEKPEPGTLPLREGGVYLITGGMGAIGLVLARHLAKFFKAKLILTCRSFFPSREDWEQWLPAHPAEDRVSRKIRRLQEIESLGGEVLVMRADVSHLEQMQVVVKQGVEQWGAIHGVIHSAGIVGDKAFTVIRDMKKTGARLHFESKIYGLLVLEKILKDRAVDFCLVMSSTASVLGGMGFGAYSAANVFMDAYIHRLSRCEGTRWISINWDGWQLEEQQAQDSRLGTEIKELAMTPEQGAEVFERVLAYEEIKQVVQCAGDLQARIDRWVKRESFKPQDNAEHESNRTAVPLFHARPHLSNPYLAPRNAIEEKLSNIWQDLLGYDRVGVRDSFFELGGDSLKAVIAISRIHKQLKIRIPLKDFFSFPTIEGLAQYTKDIGAHGYISIAPVERKEYYPLSSAQKRMFILNQLDRRNTSYNIPAVMEMRGVGNGERFNKTFRQLVRRHESLRTSFLVVNDEPVQVVHEETVIGHWSLVIGEAGGSEIDDIISAAFAGEFA